MKDVDSPPVVRDLEQEPVRSGSNSSSLLNARTFTIIILVLSLMLVLGEAWRRKVVEESDRKEAVVHCQEILVWLKISAGDSSGTYPFEVRDPATHDFERDAETSNDVFRELYRMGIGGESGNDERIFGCARSPFHPDGKLGAAPGFAEALRKGENHWAMTRHLIDFSTVYYPLIFENPAEAGMPPRWNTDVAGRAKPGRCWPDRKVVVGFNDGSVQWMQLEDGPGLRKLDRVSDGTFIGKRDLFPPANDVGEPNRILQVDQ